MALNPCYEGSPSPPHGAIVGSRRFAEMTEPSKLPHHGVPEHQPAAGGIAARARAAASPQYLSGLNPEQREAVETLDGPVLVLAGAGTGKTRVLTTRIAHILSQGRARPHEILSVTFTNKAAREMKLRLGQMLGQAVEGMPWLGTFHSIGGRILRIHAELVQLKSNFTVLDVDDQVRLLKQLLQAENIDDKRWPARMLAGLIDRWKNRGIGPDQLDAGESEAYANGRGQALYRLYQARLKALNACDFGDLTLHMDRQLWLTVYAAVAPILQPVLIGSIPLGLAFGAIVYLAVRYLTMRSKPAAASVLRRELQEVEPALHWS